MRALNPLVFAGQAYPAKLCRIETFLKHVPSRAQSVGVASFRPAWLGRRPPREGIEMRPVYSFRNELAEEEAKAAEESAEQEAEEAETTADEEPQGADAAGAAEGGQGTAGAEGDVGAST